jgi:hypothetical protein
MAWHRRESREHHAATHRIPVDSWAGSSFALRAAMPRLRCFESCVAALVLFGLSCGGNVAQTTPESGDPAAGNGGGHAGFGGQAGLGGAATTGAAGAGSDLERCGPPPDQRGCAAFCGSDVGQDFVCAGGFWSCPAGMVFITHCPRSTCWGGYLTCWKCGGENPGPVERDCTSTTECPPGSSEVPCDVRDVEGGVDGEVVAPPPSCSDGGCDAAAE